MKRTNESGRADSGVSAEVTGLAQDTNVLLKHLLELNAATAAKGQYEIAYHVLAAAHHAAEDLESIDGLRAVRQRASDQQKAIDSHPGGHPLSTTGAKSRGTSPLFDTLRLTNDAALQRLDAEFTRRRAVANLERGRAARGEGLGN